MSAAVWILMVMTLSISAACKAVPRSQPSDPLLDAIRAEEREGHLSYVESQGRELFLHYCAACHGDEGKGDGQNASNLNPPPPDLSASGHTDATLIRRVILEGSAAVGRSPLSPPWGRSLSSQEVDYLVAYCQSLSATKP